MTDFGIANYKIYNSILTSLSQKYVGTVIKTKVRNIGIATYIDLLIFFLYITDH